jgi:hypothetical protein
MRKFTESVRDISGDAVKKYIQTLLNMGEDMLVFLEKLNVMNTTLKNYTSTDTENDQIDNSVIEIDYIIENLNDITTKIDVVNDLLTSYKEDGRKNI